MKKNTKILICGIIIVCILSSAIVFLPREALGYPEGRIIHEIDDDFLTVRSNPRKVIRTVKYAQNWDVFYFDGGIPGRTIYTSSFVEMMNKLIGFNVEILLETETDYYLNSKHNVWVPWHSVNVIVSYICLGVNHSAMKIYTDFLQRNDDIKNTFVFPTEIFVDLSNSIDIYGAGMFTMKNSSFTLSNYTHDIHIELVWDNELPNDFFSIDLSEINNGLNYLLAKVYGSGPGVFKHGIYTTQITYKLLDWYENYELLGETKIEIKLGDW